jgi:hypothetical protein
MHEVAFSQTSCRTGWMMKRGSGGATRLKREKRRYWPAAAILIALLIASMAVAARKPEWSPWIGLVDGLTVGATLGATGLVRSYDESWDEFFESAVLCYLLGFFALLVYWFRRETPSAFFLIECAAGTLSYLLLAFVPPLTWLGVDLLLYTCTFIGWFFSGLFRPGYD